MKIPERIILIDDDCINNMFCNYIIKEVFHDKVESIMFMLPQKALNYINSVYSAEPVSTLMFLDINMPVLSGWDVLDELSRSEILINRYFRIYILSSSVDPTDKEHAESSPLVNGFIEKPLDVNTIKEICDID